VAENGLTPRLAARIRKDFPNDYERVISQLESAESGNQGREPYVSGLSETPATVDHPL
jgi:hypothetical protein